MAAEAIELATAYVSVVPSFEGAQNNLIKGLVPDAAAAGTEAGKAAGGTFGGGLAKGLAGAGIVAAGVGITKGLYDIGATFDDITDTIRVGTGAQGAALDGLVDVAKNVGKTIPAEWGTIGSTVADLNTRLGLSGDTLQTVASQYLEAGRILGQDVDINKTSAAFSAFHIEGDGVVGAMDTLFRVSQATGVGMNELASSVQANAPALQNLGFSFEETAALAGSLDKAGLNSTATLAAMGKGLVTLAKDGEEPQAAFRRVTGEISDLVAKGDTAAAIDLASGIFGTRAANQFIGAVQSGTLALDDLVGGVGMTSDTILGVGEDTADFAEKWQVVKNNASAAIAPLASGVFDSLGSALEKAMPYLESFGSWLTDNQWVLGVVAGIIGGTLVAAFVAWTVSIWASTVALLANPITWIIIGIVALVAALVLLIANWDSVVAFLKDVWSGIVDWLSGIWESITGGIETAWNGIKDFFSGLWTSIKNGVETGWNAVVDWIKGVPGKILDFFLNWTLPGLLVKHWDAIKEGATKGFNAVVDFVKDIPARIVRGLGNIGELLTDAGKNVIDGFLKGLKTAFENVKNFVGGIGSWIADHKGPRSYDLQLLTPAGGWIMTGLRTGIENEIPALRKTLANVTDEIQVGAQISAQATVGTAGAATSGAPGGGPLVAIEEFNAGTAGAEEIAEELAWLSRR